MATTLIESLNFDDMDLMKKCIGTDMKLVYKSQYAPAQIQKCRWGWVGQLPTLVAQFEMNAVHLKRQTNPTDPIPCFESVIMKYKMQIQIKHKIQNMLKMQFEMNAVQSVKLTQLTPHPASLSQ